MTTSRSRSEPRSVADPLVLACLAREPGYFCPNQIAGLTGLNVYAVSSALGRLIHWKKVVYVGTAEEAGYRGRGVRSTTKLYGLPGTERIVKRPETVPSRSFEFRPLKRDFYEHWRLAMETRERGLT